MIICTFNRINKYFSLRYIKKTKILTVLIVAFLLSYSVQASVSPEGCFVHWSGSWTNGQNYSSKAAAISSACSNFEQSTCSSSDWSSCSMTSCSAGSTQHTTINIFEPSWGESRACTLESVSINAEFTLVSARTDEEVSSTSNLGVSGTPYKLKTPNCKNNYHYDKSLMQCVASCPGSASWNSQTETCDPISKSEDCKNKSIHPIDFVHGYKERHEPIIGFGGLFGFDLTYHYNNFGNQEPLTYGIMANTSIVGYTNHNPLPPIPYSQYVQDYSEVGISNSATWALEDQHLGGTDQYWRMNFDDVLVKKDSQFILKTARGEAIYFTGSGSFSSNKPSYYLTQLPSNHAFAGYKVNVRHSGMTKLFDLKGQLREKISSNGLRLVFEYEDNRLKTITNNRNQSLSFNYVMKNKKSIYAYVEGSHYYPNRIISSDGRMVDLEWEQNVDGASSRRYLLTYISYPYTSSTINAGRSFDYDTVWKASISNIYDVVDRTNNIQKLYASFKYDSKGLAIESGLAGGKEKVTVSYPDTVTRIITNALGKQSTYMYTDFNGVRRLASITGEATTNCAESNTAYDYHLDGNLKSKTQNSRMTSYIYSNNNLERVTTTASGTPESIQIKTCLRASDLQIEREVQPHRVTRYEYFPSGQLKKQTVEKRTSANDSCL